MKKNFSNHRREMPFLFFENSPTKSELAFRMPHVINIGCTTSQTIGNKLFDASNKSENEMDASCLSVFPLVATVPLAVLSPLLLIACEDASPFLEAGWRDGKRSEDSPESNRPDALSCI